jgi:hypothetical protein
MDDVCPGCGTPEPGNVCCPVCDTYLPGPTRRLRRGVLWACVVDLYVAVIVLWATH